MSKAPTQAGAVQSPADDATAQRLTDLEIKLSFTEDLLDALNQTVADQQRQIDLLVREVLALRQQSSEGGAPSFRSLMEERPPHY
jgi:SlyX protein